MMNSKFGKTALVLAILSLTACDNDFDNPVDSSSSAGDADFTTFVTVGDSLTAGYADGALYLAGQESSFPKILATQFKKAGGGEFTQPLVSDNNGGLTLGGNPIPGVSTRLVLKGTSQADLSPVPVTEAPTTEVSNILTGPFNNMGVPGAKSFHAGADGYGNLAGVATGASNPYFVRFASSETASMIVDAATQQPSFFVLWLGNNDTLSFATSGGAGQDQTGNLDPTTYGSNDITDPNVFGSVMSQYVTALTAAGGKGVLVNLPDVKSIPYFTTVPFNALPLDEATATALNSSYALYNGGLAQALAATAITQEELDKRTINFAAGQNAVVIADEDLTDLSGLGLPSMRQATAADLLVLTTRTKIGTPAIEGDATSAWGVGTPLEDSDVLTPEEITAIETANAAYNATIQNIADSNPDLALTDARGIMSGLQADGLNYGSGTITSTYATGGAFSLDGVHPTARGYAVIANAIMDTIEASFSANLRRVDPNDYSTVFVE